jgi:hypothetical protein
MAHFILPVVMLLSVTCVSGVVTVGGVNFTLDKVARAAVAAPVKTNLKTSYIAVLPQTKAEALDISRLTPVVNRAADQPAAAMEARPVFTHSVAVESLRVRSGPNKTTPQLFALKGGTKVNLLRAERGWVLIDAGSGQQGWVYGKLLRPVEATAAALH